MPPDEGDRAITRSSLLSRGLLLFWSFWLSVVFASNLAEGFQQAGALPETWRFASGNLSLIRESIGIYSSEKSWAAAIFGAVVVLQLGASFLFWRASLDPAAVSAPYHPKVVQAFSGGAGLFAAFLVADEVLIVYDRLPHLPTTHLLVLCALLLSFVVISMLASRGPAGDR